jgi:DnaJ-domain-containing protein 1
MQLPGRLKATTLGDVLGSLHRERVTGTLELVESGVRTHRVHLADGLVIFVELDRATESLGEILRGQDEVDDDVLRRSLLRAMSSGRLHGDVLVRDFFLSPEVVERALRRQLLLRLQLLEELADAQILYRVTMRPPRGSLVDKPLGASEFLVGRKRARDRPVNPSSGTYRHARPSVSSGLPGSTDFARMVAYRALGLTMNAPADEVKHAYRRLVREYHPDLHPDATYEERRTLSARFAEVTAAYRSLVA